MTRLNVFEMEKKEKDKRSKIYEKRKSNRKRKKTERKRQIKVGAVEYVTTYIYINTKSFTLTKTEHFQFQNYP